LAAQLRKLALTAHVIASVGWLGVVATFFALAVVGLTHSDDDVVRAVYVVMDALGVFVLVPFALASLITGITQSLISPWGLLRHYWVVFKLVINLVATALLLLYLGTLGSFADSAVDAQSTLDEVRTASPLLHAALALVLLDIATILAVYKPRGVTPYGRRKRVDARTGRGR
jgi:hypothetical protein